MMNIGFNLKERGSALIVALWTIGLLSILVSSFAFDAHIEAKMTSHLRKRLKAEFLSRSGLEIAKMLMMRSGELTSKKSSSEDEFADQWWYKDAKDLSNRNVVSLDRELGDGVVELSIVPEDERRNVNRLNEKDWERILEVGGIDESLWAELIDSFYDWTDKDNTPRADGAEGDDYYSTLDHPYKVKNGPLDTVGELLLIKGFDRTILYGGVLKLDDSLNGADSENEVVIPGIIDLLTVYGDGRVNVNAASSRVLQTLPDVDEIVAGAIEEERTGFDQKDHPESNAGESDDQEDYSFKSVSDFLARIPDLNPSLKTRVTTSSTIYRITSTGRVGNVEKTFWCIGRFSHKRFDILRWREDG